MANLVKRCDCTCAEQTTPCDCGPAGCPALLIGRGFDEDTELPVNVPYASLGLAAADLADMVANCLAFNRSSVVPNSFSAVVASSTLFNLAMDIDNGNSGVWFAFSVGAAANLSIAWNTSTDSGGEDAANIQIFNCLTGDFVDSDSGDGSSGTLSISSLPPGDYIVLLNAGGPASFSITTFAFSSDVAMTVKPVVATWDDGGTIEQLTCVP